ncbi:dicarboxylate/amino acid:cation symporter [Gammaproteobacteria bacterium]|nr:dicarboxylate/amino acid:cation symporter [Gammaproteobacteria bacterium]MDA9314886.1 dicarboxylate/amino acid:cation symporter [bacterium]MDA7734723.1 dicarboxylate/amino acid:cation symporter [Gammaproteobacteria bacterium]MDA8674016.1 dicarboxylate/amino acid:cation symporter [Gammaproteobacteria bacterium]MDA8916217.1 dicarboxylate/amino acid:cation symporter [Gammaproteobacteria bacterium]|tara:strand:- start:2897 stop:4147 length:1251 start_codon:yes stop_codon:yes gene_type:complete
MIDAPKNLTRNILLGMLVGFVLGAILYYSNFLPLRLKEFIEIYVFNLGSSIFVNLLKLLIVPLVFFSLVSGISSLTNMTSLGNITLKTVSLYLSTTAIAVTLSLIIGSIFKPGSGYSSNISPPDKLPQGQGIYETILDIFPSNIIEAMANNQMLAVVFFSILFGLALNKTNHLTNNFSESFEKLNTVFMQLVIMIISFAPIGVFCLIGKFVIADGLDIFQEAFKYVTLLILVLFIHAFVTYSLILKMFTNLSLFTFFKKMREVAIFAFSTSSSAATIPVTLKTVQDNLGVNKNVASFVIPVGATINMDGTAIMQGMATIFIAQMSGIDLSLIQYVQVVILAVVTSIGTAAVPSAGTITLVIILQQFGLPLEAIGIILAVDRILDMLRTSVNVTGDAAVACIVANSEGLLDKNIYNK